MQLKVDVEVYNDRNPDAVPIQPVFDFSNDTEEALLGDDDGEERKAG